MEVPKVYKVMRIDPEDGKLKSVYAGNPKHCLIQYPTVIYKEGEIAYAPRGQLGLSAFGTYEGAKYFCKTNKVEDVMVIHEAVPLGKRGGGLWDCDDSDCTYPALLIGKEVWRSEPEKPKEGWVDVTRELTFEPYYTDEGTSLRICHAHCIIGYLGVEPNLAELPTGYKYETHAHSGNHSGFVKILKKV